MNLMRLRELGRRILWQGGYHVFRAGDDLVPMPRVWMPWLEPDTMRRFIGASREDVETGLFRTALTPDRVYLLLQVLDLARRHDGAVAEFGVWRGGCALLMAAFLAARCDARELLLFDTFQGMPAPDPEQDTHQAGDYGDTSAADVRALLQAFPSVKLCGGHFRDSFGTTTVEHLAFAHVDCDLYESLRLCCEFITPRLVVGGAVVFDDYGFASCPGVRRAVDEFYEKRPERPLYLTTGQCVVIRTS